MSSSDAAITNYTKRLLYHFGFQNCVRVEALQDVESGQAFYRTMLICCTCHFYWRAGLTNSDFQNCNHCQVSSCSHLTNGLSCSKKKPVSEESTVLHILGNPPGLRSQVVVWSSMLGLNSPTRTPHAFFTFDWISFGPYWYDHPNVLYVVLAARVEGWCARCL